MYIESQKTANIIQAKKDLASILTKYGYAFSDKQLSNLFIQQENRYVKLADGLNATLAKKINDLINDNYSIKSTCDNEGDTCVK